MFEIGSRTRGWTVGQITAIMILAIRSSYVFLLFFQTDRVHGAATKFKLHSACADEFYESVFASRREIASFSFICLKIVFSLSVFLSMCTTNPWHPEA